MKYEYTDSNGAIFRLSIQETVLKRQFFKERNESLLAIVWNRGDDQIITIDEVPMLLPSQYALTLMVSQSFSFEKPSDIILWQYNREFYCIVDHDREVSCVGFLFYGARGSMMIALDFDEQESFGLLLRVFQEECKQKDLIQGEMLRVLLKRLIIKLTRLAMSQHLQEKTSQPALDLIRQYSLLVENNYRRLHQVQDYAALLNKSPKTLANLFAQNQQPSPLAIITNRIALEGRRLLTYTDKTISEISFELGFEESAHFSRFFKQAIGKTPRDFRISYKKNISGKIGI